MVVGHVPGRVLGQEGWTDEVIAAHARQLTRLHEHPHAGHGKVTDDPADLTPTLSILEAAEASMEFWRADEDGGDADVLRLWPGGVCRGAGWAGWPGGGCRCPGRRARLVFETFLVTLHFRRLPDRARYEGAIRQLTRGQDRLVRSDRW